MKKIFLILTAFLILCPKSYAENTDNIAILTQKGFFDVPHQASSNNPCEDIKKTMYTHLKYANNYNLEGLKSLYAPNYTNVDGLSRDIYFDLIKKTWESYPDIKYKITIKDIEINGNMAVAQVNEDAVATTNAKSGLVNEKGLLESVSGSVYYFENINNKWLITSDHILFEKTYLRYGSARDIDVDLIAPFQVTAGTQYTSSLKIKAPKDNLVIASIGQENITYPQTVAEEAFRKLPEDGVLERMFKSNDENINEYAVASFGITKAELNKPTEIKVYVTGLGFLMSRVNVLPKNNYIKVENEEKTD